MLRRSLMRSSPSSALVSSSVRAATRPVVMARPIARTQMVNSRGLFGFRSYSETANGEKKDAESAANEASSENTKEETQTSESEYANLSVEELQSKLKELQSKFEAKDKEVAKFKEHYTRSVADFRNLQETTKREIQKARDYALQKFAKDLLDSVDNFDRALAVVPEEKRSDKENHVELANLYEGVKMTQEVFEKTLARHGLVKLNPLGEKFDPNVHEATFEVPQPDKEPGTVFHVQQTGFALNDRVLRAPKVGVVKGTD
ncbi:Mge1p [Sugiyamaella lignohabitans]|uniref:GrpE protein homolog, mitochondrial n=1 Tax=Sugiyamaella lignohabitans TaxID=796027 RepID=A0A167F187_9ASCO|nr:Mge1p [Sugiyamaella lignohabitans]ANB14695.1 Mge1p [Sugiyamaella lignohabitans]